MTTDDLQTQTRAGRSVGRRGNIDAVLRAVHPRDVTWSVQLGIKDLVVGRVATGDAAPGLTHDTVSRQHFQLTFDARRRCHTAQDLGSHNGTRVGGAPLQDARVELTDQEVIQLGDVSLVYEQVDPAMHGDGLATDAIPGDSPQMARIRAAVERIAADPSPAMLYGETGTGKEWIAQELHRRSGRPGPLVAVNCAALSPQIVDSQLFGHVRGAFTGANTDHPGMFRAANGGTLFLDEIGELPLALQPKLLRALQEREVQPVGSTKLVPVDVRVISATNRNLANATERGEFRRDLYARLTLWELSVPALRERRGDILMWIDRLQARWLEARSTATGQPLVFTPQSAEQLLLHGWPSNLREVDQLVHALAAAPVGVPLGPEHLPETVAPVISGRSTTTTAARPVRAPSKPPVPSRDEFVAAFEELGGNVRAIAKRFARDRRQIYRWIKSHGLSGRQPRPKGD